MASVCTIVAIQRKSRGYGGSRRDLWEDDNSMGFGWWNGFVGCMWYGIPSKSRVVGPPRREELEVVALLRAEGGWHKPESPLKIGCQPRLSVRDVAHYPRSARFFSCFIPRYIRPSPLFSLLSLNRNAFSCNNSHFPVLPSTCLCCSRCQSWPSSRRCRSPPSSTVLW